MPWYNFETKDWMTAVAIGIAVSVLTAAIMAVGLKTGLSPLPKPLGLAFAETVLGRSVPLPIGLLFHAAWTTSFSVLYIMLFRDAPTFLRAFYLALALWILVLVFFFPLVGWGFLGLSISPRLMIGVAVPHLLFAVSLWGLCRWAYKTEPAFS